MSEAAIKEIKKYVEELKSIESHILKYIESEDDDDENFQELIKSLSICKISSQNQKLKYLLFLLKSISDYHSRSPTFFSKIEQIILFYQKEIKQTFSNLEIFNFFDDNKIILLFLLENNLLTIDKEIANLIFSEKYKKFQYRSFFSPELDRWKESDPENNEIETEQLIEFKKRNKKYKHGHFLDKKKKGKKDDDSDDSYEKIDLDSKTEELRKIGENESYICELIRNDSIDDFIVYFTKKDLKPTFKIKPSIFESNLLLNEKKISLIEYAAFYGSIQIFQYLSMNGSELSPFLWNCVIHSKNAEMIHKLENLNVKPPNNNYENCLIEAIKCHYFDIFDYISVNYMNNNNVDNLIKFCFKFNNFLCLTDEKFYENKFFFLSACKYNHSNLVKLLIQIDNSFVSQSEVSEI